jgi:hypothetical protein
VRQLVVAIGVLRRTGPCPALIDEQGAFKAAYGSGYDRLSSTDEAEIRQI